MKRKLLSIGFALAAFFSNQLVFGQAYTENFDAITNLPTNGWVLSNVSVPVGSTGWTQGPSVAGGGPFDSFNGAADAFISANFNNTGSVGTISNWLLTPNRTLRNGDVFTFYTRKVAPDAYADQLEVRLSTNGASTNVGSGAAVGDFTSLLLSINPTLVLGVYPTAWTQYTITISGLPAPTSGRIAFRYFVTNGGSAGANSDFIGIDNVVYTPYTCPTFTLTPAGSLSGATAGSAYSETLTQSGALGAPNFSVTAGSLPPGIALAADGTLSGTPTATGTFNFTVTVNDASGCSGSSSYSITVACQSNPIILASAPALCDNSGLYTLVEGAPSGGSYAGTGVTGTTFDPSVGTQMITYSYTDPYGCAFNSNYTITVNNAPNTSLSSIPDLCSTQGIYTLTEGSPAGGSYSGTGVFGTDFDPSVGSQTITYTFTDGAGCTESATATITVIPSVTATLTPFSPVCSNDGPLVLTGGSPAGGDYSGTGVTNGTFDPSVSTQTITYTVGAGTQCESSAMETITVFIAPNTQLSLSNSAYCVYNNAVTLTGGTPAGGTYSGNGVSNGQFDPSVAGLGTTTVSYEVVDGNGCSATATATITVDACATVAENGSLDLQLFPNPTMGEFNLTINESIQTYELELVDLAGKTIPVSVSVVNENRLKIIPTSIEYGNYFVKGAINGKSILVSVTMTK